jgi:hypothetical protein
MLILYKFLEKVNPKENTEITHYLPHYPVIKEGKKV